jgi:hypothetical protein
MRTSSSTTSLSSSAAAAWQMKTLLVLAAVVALWCPLGVVVHSFVVIDVSQRPPHMTAVVARRGPATTHSPSLSQRTRLYLFKDFFTELDKFLDDASARRLGNGAAFYGKRKSNFYGANDKNRKIDTNIPDPTEDYQAPNAGGYFQWMKDENGQMRPVTRMKKQVVERNMKFWDNVYADEDDDDGQKKKKK